MKPVKRTSSARTNNANYMSDKAFADLKDALVGALAFERGERRTLKITGVQMPAADSNTTKGHRSH
jgi:hypothetical protein